MPKQYSKDRIPKNFKQKPLTKYEEWIFTKVRKEFLDVNTILRIRNKFNN